MTERIHLIRGLAHLEWTKEQEKKLSDAFSLIDEVMRECEREGQRKEFQAIATARYHIEMIVTAFMIKQLVSDIQKGEEDKISN